MNVKDVISAVVDTMKPDIKVYFSRAQSPGYTVVEFTAVPLSARLMLFVAERLQLTYADGEIRIGTITSITQRGAVYDLVVTLTEGKSGAPATAVPVINFHHGRPLEIVNTFKQIAQNSTYNKGMFPAICLFSDYPEVISYERSLTLQLVIITDTSKHYTVAERYINSFDPILTPLYELFLKQLAKSNYVDSDSDSVLYFEHIRWNRPCWGKDGIYGAVADIFNDFIDAIEIENLKLKILKTC